VSDGAPSCPGCGAPLAERQRWCLACGAPAAVRIAPTPRWAMQGALAVLVALLALAGVGYALATLAGS
jgi:hypothetical protein